MQNEVSKESWVEWLQHPVTKTFRTLLLMRREDLKEQCIEGIFTDASDVGNALLYGKAIGGAKAYKDLLELDEVTVNQELSNEDDDGKQLGAAASGPSGAGGTV